MIKKTITKVAATLAISALFSGCAPIISGVINASINEDSLVEKTATYFSAPRESIAISGIKKEALATSYLATYKGKSYNCSVYYGAVNCKSPGPQDARVDADIVSREQVRAATPSAADIQTAATDRGMTPAQAQARLNQLGYEVGTPDGILGKKSVEKLKAFQKSRGLATNGKLDEPTIQALR